MRDLERRLARIEKMLQPPAPPRPPCERIFFYDSASPQAELDMLAAVVTVNCGNPACHHLWLPRKIEWPTRLKPRRQRRKPQTETS